MNKTKVKEKEVTRVMTVRITVIGDEKDMMDKKEATKEMEELIKGCLNADDVKVMKVQDFVADKK